MLIGRALLQAQRLPAAQRNRALTNLFQLRDLAIRGITSRYVQHPWAASFKLIVSPLVTWLWLGAILAALGGLIALWPMPLSRRSRRRLAASGRESRPDGASTVPPIPDAERQPELV